jgi:hypothetical protein
MAPHKNYKAEPFYTKCKSLIFCAYDLAQQVGAKIVTFQALGPARSGQRTGGQSRSPLLRIPWARSCPHS